MRRRWPESSKECLLPVPYLSGPFYLSRGGARKDFFWYGPRSTHAFPARAVLVLSALHVSHPMLLDTPTIICVHLPSKKGAHLIYQIVGKPLTALFRVFRRYKNTDDQIQEHGRTLVLMLPPTPTPPTPPTPTPPRGPRSRRDDHRVLQHTR